MEEGEEQEGGGGGGISAAAAFTSVWNLGVSHLTHMAQPAHNWLAGGVGVGAGVKGQLHVVTHLESYYRPPSGVSVCLSVCLSECCCKRV